MSSIMTFLQLSNDEDLYSTNDHNAIKVTAAILGIVCVLIAIVMSVFMYQHYLRRRQLTISTYQPIHSASTSSGAPLITARAQRKGQTADIEANIDSPPSPVMQQGLLQNELVRSYDSNSHHHNNAFLKPLPQHS